MNIPKERLDQAKQQLKSEFDGIDDIIEHLFRILASWRDTANRPTVVPMFGMTGVGKTSLVNRAIELLGLSDRTFKFTCGSSDNFDHSSKFQNQLIEKIGFSEYDTCTSITLVKSDSVFIFDECQKMRTINMGREVDRSEYNEIWKLLDEGGIDYQISDAADVTMLEKWAMVLDEIIRPKCSGCTVDRTKLKSPGIIEDLEVLGLIEYVRDSELYKQKFGKKGDYVSEDDLDEASTDATIHKFSDEAEDWEVKYHELERKRRKRIDKGDYFADVATFNFETDEQDTIYLVPHSIRVAIRNSLSELFSIKETMERMKKFLKKQTFDEFCDLVSELLRVLKSPHRLDFHNSLIFVIGNIDEAFENVDDYIDADTDADLLHKITKHVNVNEVKDALEYRFRKEEISRLGNNYILYPTFNRQTFRKIITRHLNYNIASYQQLSPVKITYGDEIIDLLYSEGVFPAQGARPAMSTVNSFCSIFTEIDGEMASRTSGSAISSAHICLIDKPKDFKCDSIDITIKFTDGDGAQTNRTIQYPLLIGRLRNTAHDDSRYIKAVHELGHAFMTMLEKGLYPSMIVTTSSDTNGGFCIANLEEMFRKPIYSIDTIHSSVKYTLGGWVAERLVFPSEINSLGSDSDIEKLWSEIARSYYIKGRTSPLPHTTGYTNESVPTGMYDENLDGSLKKEIFALIDETKNTLGEYLALLKHVALHLAEKGSFTEQELKDFLQNIGDDADADVRRQRDLLIEKMNGRAQNHPSPSTYKDYLLKKDFRGDLDDFTPKPTRWQRFKAKFKRG